MTDNEPLHDIDFASEYTGLPKSSIYRLTSQNAIPCYKIGSLLRFRLSEIDGWLAEKSRGNGGGE